MRGARWLCARHLPPPRRTLRAIVGRRRRPASFGSRAAGCGGRSASTGTSRRTGIAPGWIGAGIRLATSAGCSSSCRRGALSAVAGCRRTGRSGSRCTGRSWFGSGTAARGVSGVRPESAGPSSRSLRGLVRDRGRDPGGPHDQTRVHRSSVLDAVRRPARIRLGCQSVRCMTEEAHMTNQTARRL